MSFKFFVCIISISFRIQVWGSQSTSPSCYRECQHGESPKICKFVWVLEHYQSMGPACGDCANGNITDCFNPMCVTVDGVERGLLTTNRQIPGPPIHVCKNDILVIDLVNNMEGSGATYHWHGLRMRNFSHMDGVPFITQCPIPFETTFRYTFPANESGTFFYHSHSGHHKTDGLYGGIVIREPFDPNSNYYDYDLPEHLIIASDWMHDSTDMWIKGLSTRKPGIYPTNLLINGKGKFWIDTKTNTSTLSPIEVFQVKKGGRYRFRLVNSGSHTCIFKLQIEKHKMQIIATDSHPVHPRIVDTLYFSAGERYDFVVEANQTVGNYWVKLHGAGACQDNGLVIEQYALLTYTENSDLSYLSSFYRPIPFVNDELPSGIVLNNPNATCYSNENLNNNSSLCSADLQSIVNFDATLASENVNRQFIFGFDQSIVDNDFIYSKYLNYMTFRNQTNLIGEIGNISMTFPSFPVLSQRNEIVPDTFCDPENLPNNCQRNEICMCTHVEKLKLNSTVELIIFDKYSNIRQLNHPWHLHGHEMLVLGMGQFPENMTMSEIRYRIQNDANFLNKFPPNHKPPSKDTVSVPSRGYVVLRFRADNPGFWLFHCHFEWHLGTGMGLIFQVGELDEMEMIPNNFPKCGNFFDSYILDKYNTYVGY